MERQFVIDAYEKAKRDYEQMQRDAAQPDSPVSKEALEMAKSMLDMVEMSKRQSDIDWQHRLENAQ